MAHLTAYEYFYFSYFKYILLIMILFCLSKGSGCFVHHCRGHTKMTKMHCTDFPKTKTCFYLTQLPSCGYFFAQSKSSRHGLLEICDTTAKPSWSAYVSHILCVIK